MMRTFCITLITSLLFFACSQPEEDLQEMTTGKVSFTLNYDDIPVIELSNARQNKLIRKVAPWITVINKETSKVVLDDWLDEGKSYPLAFGKYSFEIKVLNQATKEVEGSSGLGEITISKEEPQNLAILIHVKYVMVDVFLEGFDEAKVWIGEEGFTPSDEYLYTPESFNTGGYDPENTARFHADKGRFEIVVEHAGEIKKFGADCKPAHYYRVTITKKASEPSVKNGSFQFGYYTALEDSPDQWNKLSFEW